MTHASAPSGISQRVRYRFYGLAFLLVVALAVALTIALYQKTFNDVVSVKVRTDRAGLQLLNRSDVKVRGLIVGEVRGIRATANGAEIDLAIDSDKAKLVPDNSQARLLPKTLFGEKYVALETPAQPGSAIREGQVLEQDRTQAAVEVGKVLDDLLPVLQAVQPEKLNATLNALATALQGRGDQLGRNLEQVDYLLKKINPKLPTLMYDIRALADVSDIYDEAAPDLLQTLRNLNVTSQTIVDKRTEIEALIPAVTAVSGKGTRFVGDNTNKIIGVNIASRAGLELAATYSPELPCVFDGLMKFKPRVESAVGGRNPMLNLTVEIVKPRPAYKRIDLPEAKDYRKPRCYGLPNPKVPFPDYIALDGTEDDLWWKDAANSGVPNTDPIATTPGYRGRTLSAIFLQPGSDTTDEEMIKNVVAPLMRVPADQVPDAAALIFGPVMHGGVVTVK
ncbi:MCE family protein [Actinomadura scrupuli]|uniref:MCE family protein n=1 Tax=Actinomadura scrupuli TaxID=559629 RepID=UPI003D9A00F3